MNSLVSLFQAMYLMVPSWCFWAMHKLVLYVGTFAPPQIPCFRTGIVMRVWMWWVVLLSSAVSTHPTQSWLPLLTPQTESWPKGLVKWKIKPLCWWAVEWLSNYCCWGGWGSQPVLSPTWEDTEHRYSSKSLFLLLLGKLSALPRSAVGEDWQPSALCSEDLRMRSCTHCPAWKGLSQSGWSHYGRIGFPACWGWT